MKTKRKEDMQVEATEKRTSGFVWERKGNINANAFSITKMESSTFCTCSNTLWVDNNSVKSY